MPDMLNMDEPQEVIAASSRFAGAITSVTDRVGVVVDDLVLPANRDSPLDQRCGAVNDWIGAHLSDAGTRFSGHAVTTHQQARDRTVAIAGADAAGATEVSGTESI
ncbi:hypothetical protein [Nocardia vaccinii]|uniref:hypothetical protein n=1 Tax=Nocardia vaccinii TaxID=1822 RepID=UPI000833B593|nr:hypothetical protein [Nocardia vaccinii]